MIKTLGTATALALLMLGGCAMDSGGGMGGGTPGGGVGEGKNCGGVAAVQCASDLYCAYPAGQPFPDQGGQCKAKPTICPQIFQPVCGRDAKTYPNTCVANSRGVSVATTGACPGS